VRRGTWQWTLLLMLPLVIPTARAQYSVAWWTVDGGGALRSTGGDFELSGTIGQPDAGVLSGGSLQLHGGFWPGVPTLPYCRGDMNCDGVINWRDIDYLIAAQNDNLSAWMALFPPPGPQCAMLAGDTSLDGHVNWRDIDPFIALMNTTCP
jgi:hypothetical protein